MAFTGIQMKGESLIIIIIIILLLASFSCQCQLLVLHRKLSDSKSHQVTKTLLGILVNQQCYRLVDLDSSPDFQFFQSSFQAFEDYSKCTNYKWYFCYLMFYQSFNYLARLKYLFIFTLSFIFTWWVFIPVVTGGLHWSFVNCKFLQLSRTFLSILVDLISVVAWMVSILPWISNSIIVSFQGSSELFQRIQLWLVSLSPSYPIMLLT